jgi:hypothetical protein
MQLIYSFLHVSVISVIKWVRNEMGEVYSKGWELNMLTEFWSKSWVSLWLSLEGYMNMWSWYLKQKELKMWSDFIWREDEA